MKKDFDYWLQFMPRKADNKCDLCRGSGEMYANEGGYITCYCTNDIQYMDDECLIFYHKYIDKRSGKPKRGAKDKYIKEGLEIKKLTCRWCFKTKPTGSCTRFGELCEVLNGGNSP